VPGLWRRAGRVSLETAVPPVFGKEMRRQVPWARGQADLRAKNKHSVTASLSGALFFFVGQMGGILWSKYRTGFASGGS